MIRYELKIAEVYYLRGASKYDHEDFDGAIEDFSRAIKLKPEFAEAYSIRGATYLKINHPMQAREDFFRANQLGGSILPM